MKTPRPAKSASRVGRMKNLAKHSEVPIRYYNKIQRKDGSRYELIYAGTKVPNKGKRVLRNKNDREKIKSFKADYSDSNEIGILHTLLHNPEIVGTHGFVSFAEKKGEIELRAIGVPEEFQGKGIADKLLERLERIAKARGIHTITLITRTNTRAFNFFYRNGFRVITDLYEGTHISIFEKKPREAVQMAKFL